MGFKFTPGCNCCATCTDFLFATNGANATSEVSHNYVNLIPGITADENNDATVTFPAGTLAAVARPISSNHGFAIPLTATITSITVRIECWASVGGNRAALHVHLTKNGVAPVFPPLSTVSPLSPVLYLTTTVQTKDWVGGPAFTPAEVNSPTFGAWITTACSTDVDLVAHIDYVAIRVCYNP